jgi:serine/threonine-protein kinase
VRGHGRAHRRGIVHRDLKPSNILITNGEPEIVKVIDFGIAKMTGSGVRTTTANPQGTALYMAPEQLQNAQADPRMDVYAMGLLLYKGATGSHPMGDAPRALIDIVAWHLTQTPRRLREVAPEVPLDLEELVHRCLEKDPARRPQTMRDLAEGLDAALVRLLVPRVRGARNVPVPGRPAALAPTHAMPAVSEPGSAPEVSSQKPTASPRPSAAMPASGSASALGGTAIMTAAPTPAGATDPVSAPASAQRVALGGTAIMPSVTTADVPTQRSPQPPTPLADVARSPRDDRPALLPLGSTDLPPLPWTPPKARGCARSHGWRRGSAGRSRPSSKRMRCGWRRPETARSRRWRRSST